MSTNTNVACCTIPPVISSQKSKGTFVSYAGFDKVYTTGQSTDKAIVCVYDIFGFWNQTQIGADTIAEVLNAKVFMPDFFQPHAPFPPSRHPPKNDDDKKALQDFFGGPAEIGKSTTKLADFGKALRSDGFKQVLVYGFCWGGKVTMKAGATDVFDAIAVVHPAMVDAKDAEVIRVPLALYPSNDEPAEECEKVMKVLSTKPFAAKNSFKIYSNMFHGWAAARANLDDPENLKEYDIHPINRDYTLKELTLIIDRFNDLYSTLAGYFNNILKA